MSTNFLSGLFGAVKGAGLTGCGAQAARGAVFAVCAHGMVRKTAAETIRNFRIMAGSLLSIAIGRLAAPAVCPTLQSLDTAFTPGLKRRSAALAPEMLKNRREIAKPFC
jgi:hypothetical protein